MQSKKSEKLRNNLYEIEKLMQDIFTQKSISKCENKCDNSLKKSLFLETLACEKLRDKARFEYKRCFNFDGFPKVDDELLKEKEEIYKNREAQYYALRQFLVSNELIEEFEKYKKSKGA
ncbi:MAG: hypothetical protein ACI4HN_04715 [Ruminococcus sp.]